MTVNSVEKAGRILVHLARSRSQSAAQIATELELARSTTYKILVTLETQGLVERGAGENTFHLGHRLIELGHRAQEEIDLYRVSHPFLTALNESTGETVHLTVLDDLQVLYVDCVESTRRLRTYSVIGLRGPLHSTAVGKAILAFQDRALLQRVITAGLPRQTDATITVPEKLAEELERTHSRGYAIDDLENDPDIRCVAAPIRDERGEAVAAVSLSGPAERLTRDRAHELAPLVQQAADGIEQRAASALTRPVSA